jgi:methylmalonyl-CoA mutase N-terminal domain/subunit
MAQKARLQRVKQERDQAAVSARLRQLQEVARSDDNLMPMTLECVRAHASVGEIVTALKDVFGLYREPIVF